MHKYNLRSYSGSGRPLGYVVSLYSRYAKLIGARLSVTGDRRGLLRMLYLKSLFQEL